MDTCEETVGRKTRQHKEWITAETLKKVQIRKVRKEDLNNSRTRAGKAEAQKQYTIANKDVKSSIRKDKRNFVENLVRQAANKAAQKNMKELCETTRKLSGKRRKNDIPVTDKNDRTLPTRQEDQLKRWAEHFKELLNRPPPTGPADICNIPAASHPLPINTS